MSGIPSGGQPSIPLHETESQPASIEIHPWGGNGFTAAHPGFLHDLLWFPYLLSLVPLYLVPLPVKPSGIIQVESAICVLSSSYQHIYSVYLEEILRLE